MDNLERQPNDLSQCQQRIADLEANLARVQRDYTHLQAERDRIAATVKANEALKRSLNHVSSTE